MLPTIERILFLRSADIFSVINGEDLAPLAMVAQEVTFTAGETFIRQGEPGDCLYIVVDGEVEIAATDGKHAGSGATPVAVRGPGSVIGEMAVLSGGTRAADCVARTDVLALQLSRDDFLEMLEERPALAIGVIEVLTRRLDQATQRAAANRS